MKHLVHLSFPYYTYHALIVLNEAERLIQEGNQVEVILCGGGVNHCYANMMGDKSMCGGCKKMQKQWVNMLSPEHTVRYYQDYIQPEMLKDREFTYDNEEDIKGIIYKGVKIGYGAYSSYVTRTKNLHPLMNGEFREFFDKILKTECVLTDLLENYVSKEKPDSVMVFSARHFDVRPFYDYPLQNNLGVECLEAGFTLRKDVYMGFNYGKSQPHSIEFHNGNIFKQWNDSTLSETEKIMKGTEFFERKRNNIPSGGLLYTAGQKPGELPANWDSSKKNIVIFNSSEDEFVAVGDEYSKKAFFPDQFIGINEISEMLRNEKNVQLYVRVHPAQKNIHYKYHQELYNLPSKFPNVTIIHANDTISSYSLIDHAEKIIVFGSTIGIEAVYWNKPVILLAGALYYYLDQCYIPKTKAELHTLLVSDLMSRRTDNVVKLGYYMIEERGYELSRIQLGRKQKLPFSPMKSNRESYWGMINRFFYSYFFTKKEYKNFPRIPKQER